MVAARGGATKWNLAHLPPGTSQLFTDKIAPLARIKAGRKEPWAGLSRDEVQEIVDEVLGKDEYEVKDGDVWSDLISYRLNDWRNLFAKQGINAVSQLVDDHQEILDSKQVIADTINTLLIIPEGEKAAPFQWQEYNDGVNKKGLFRSALILRVFALAHLINFDSPTDAIRKDKPIGALLLATQAVERALTFWKTGELVEDRSATGHFSADNYGDKRVHDRVSKMIILTRRATRFLSSVKALDDNDWEELISEATEYLPKVSKGKGRASTSSRPNSEVYEVEEDFVLKSD
ncbi:hypothetical protein H0H93_002301 [Arthromyces matolae]|nr:hypothetical protein H0H93_002301 [Arthromyces matolae]